ncbi:hypothetical protein [Actinokineospora globicatena]|uniref:hypothetical protein n=1 Tax=Actinokineospora globicatena TaxID=103729 RepID=UPI0020A3C00E|nr:hypothetical protein [Actinokineospora globicatena]GLW78010.1 hypothetical protein Aglo01_24920 [Actinokineospora globicatena]GLW85324.1 hypothetical protein Aglo02_29640 [Actinokineospora globicatena]
MVRPHPHGLVGYLVDDPRRTRRAVFLVLPVVVALVVIVVVAPASGAIVAAGLVVGSGVRKVRAGRRRSE